MVLSESLPESVETRLRCLETQLLRTERGCVWLAAPWFALCLDR